MNKLRIKALVLALFIALPSAQAQASALSRAVRTADNMEPAVPLPEQNKIAQKKLADFEKRTGRKPNILLLLVDDMGWGDPGVYGGGIAMGAATPNIDKLAGEGLRLTSAYSQPTCTPTRSAIMTGRLPIRTGLLIPILAGASLKLNPWEGETSIAKILSEEGYTTILSGKWHIGESDGMKPQQVGFDEFYGYYGAQKEVTQGVDERRFPDLLLDKEKLAAYNKMEAQSKIGLVHGFKNGEEKLVYPVKSIEDMAEGDAHLKDFTVSKIKELAKSGKPWFIEHAFMKIHADNFASKEFKGKSASKYPVKDAVVEVDAYVGDIMQTLKDTGQLDNTFVFFTSDNGPQLDTWSDKGYTPFKGGKGTAWDGGVRVPAIAYWKGMITPGQTSDELFDLMDLFNTYAALAGGEDKIPKDKYIDGINQLPFLLVDNGRSARDKIFIWLGSNFMAIRMYEYKEHFKVVKFAEPNLAIDMATIEDVGLAPWLFNLYIDPKESYPVGHRRNAWLASMGEEAKAHIATFKKYPPKKAGLGGVKDD